MAYGIARIFRSTDENAPQYNGSTYGTLKNVLKAVLVDGYGSTAPLGWTTEYEEGHVIVFRSEYGRIRPYIRIDDGVSPYGTLVRTYTSMLDINNGTEPMPPLDILAYLIKSNSNNTVNVPWIIIGDEAGFYLLSRHMYPTYTTTTHYGSLWCLQYIGAFNNIDVRNVWNFCVHLGVIGGYLTGMYYNFSLAGNTSLMHYGYSASSRGCDFAKGPVSLGLKGIGSSYAGVNMAPGFINTSTNVRKINGVYILNPLRLVEYKNNTLITVGCLPGLFEPLCKDYITTTLTADTVPYDEYYDSNGDLNIFFTLQNYNYGDFNSLSKVVIKTGRGFRNVL